MAASSSASASSSSSAFLQYQAIPSTLKEPTRLGPDRPCKIYQELTFSTPVKLRFLVFRNHFVHTLTIKHKPLQAVDGAKWQTVLRNRTLMEDPHCEGDAQSWHRLDLTELSNPGIDLDNVQCLRIYINQPSPNWRNFMLKNMTCYTLVPRPAPAPPAAKCEMEEKFPSQYNKMADSMKEVVRVMTEIRAHHTSFASSAVSSRIPIVIESLHGKEELISLKIANPPP